MGNNPSGAWPFICSVCGQPLDELQGVMRCEGGHSFDVARQGYVNLLAGADAERGITGDTRAMLHARRRFLEAGYFDPLLKALTSDVGTVLQSVGQDDGAGFACVLEVGCGEGFYIGNMADSAMPGPANLPLVRYVGLDVSKDAVRLAAGRYRAARFAVANARRRLYASTGSVNVLLSIFAPRNEVEFRRVLAPDGVLVVVLPGQAHMEHVREAFGLLDMEAAKEERVLGQFAEHFVLNKRRVVEYALVLPPEGVRDYIAMGPNAYHTKVDTGAETDEIRTVASFVLLQLARRK